MLFTDADCSISEIDSSQVEMLASDPELEWYALRQLQYQEYQKDSPDNHLDRGDDRYITLTAVVEKGRLPEAENEIVAERWALLNMGIEPVCGEKIEIYDEKAAARRYVTWWGYCPMCRVIKNTGSKCSTRP